MTMTRTVSCGTCQFWAEGTAKGSCHRYPKALATTRNHFCGEWQPMVARRDDDEGHPLPPPVPAIEEAEDE